jgi:excisionase family DNA binding protein
MRLRTDYMTITEIAELLGVQRNTLTAHRTRGKMPPPDRQFGRTPLWRRSTIEKWRPAAKDKP